MAMSTEDTDTLIQRALGGDDTAREALLARHRSRLRTMVALRMNSRLAARFDASDVVQDALAEAARRLPDYLHHQPLPFYPWLRQIAWQRLVELHRQHAVAKKRSVNREEQFDPELSDQSVAELAQRLTARQAGPSSEVQLAELREQVRTGLMRLAPHDRKVLTLRFLEQLSVTETAAILGVGEAAARMRQLRALERLGQFVDRSQ